MTSENQLSILNESGVTLEVMILVGILSLIGAIYSVSNSPTSSLKQTISKVLLGTSVSTVACLWITHDLTVHTPLLLSIALLGGTVSEQLFSKLLPAIIPIITSILNNYVEKKTGVKIDKPEEKDK